MGGEISVNWDKMSAGEKSVYFVLIVMAIFSVIMTFSILGYYLILSVETSYFFKYLIMISIFSTLCSICVIINIAIKNDENVVALYESKTLKYIQSILFVLTEVGLPLWVMILVINYYKILKNYSVKLTKDIRKSVFWTWGVLYNLIPLAMTILLAISKNIGRHGTMFSFTCKENEMKTYCEIFNYLSLCATSCSCIVTIIFSIFISLFLKNIKSTDVLFVKSIREFGYKFLVYPLVAVISFAIDLLFSSVTRISENGFVYFSSVCWSGQGIVFPLTVGLSTGIFKSMLCQKKKIKVFEEGVEGNLTDSFASEGSGIY